MHKKIFRPRFGGNGKNKKRIDKIGQNCIFAEYEINGVNIANLLNRLKKEKISLYKVRFIKEKTVTLRVKVKDEKKFFAITKNLCYNVKKRKNCGNLLHLISLLISPSIIVGAVLFIILSVYFSNLILGFSFIGSGVRYSDEVRLYLKEAGIEERCFVKKDKLEKIANGILSRTDKFSFVSIKKKGSRLIVELILSSKKPYIQNDSERNLYSNIDGVIEEIKLYRGTSMVEVGDMVKCGDLLVLGQMEIKETLLEVNALAVVTIKAQKDFNYISSLDNDEENAIIFATSSINEECEEVLVDKIQKNGKYYYKVTVFYKRIIYTG